MAQRKSSSASPRKPSKYNAPAAKKTAPSGKAKNIPTGKAKDKASSAAGKDSAVAGLKSPGRPPAKKPGKSIVNQKQTPWALITTSVVIAVFAIGIIAFAVLHKSSSSSSNSSSTSAADATGPVVTTDPYSHAELPAAKAIAGVTYTVEPNHTHVQGNLKYNASPPIGGNHSQYWADCTGTVYPKAIANENAVHMLEHGAVWITYKQGLPAAQLATLTKLVSGVDRMALSPYPNLKTNISLQAWGYQLFVDNASDPRIQQFITALKYNQQTTPEPSASCSQPTFKAHPSTFGHPLWVPA